MTKLTACEFLPKHHEKLIKRIQNEPDFGKALGFTTLELWDLRDVTPEYFSSEEPAIIRARALEVLATIHLNLDPMYNKYTSSSVRIYDTQSPKELLSIHFYNESITLCAQRKRDFYFEAERQRDDGRLCLSTVLVRGKTRQLRSPFMPRFGELFTKTMEFYQANGWPVTGVYGAWATKLDGQENTNLKVYKAKLAQGHSYAEAALATPTGKLASRHGFTRVELDEGLTAENPIKKGGVTVIFYR